MTEIHEETHYQIALTNRQVLAAFVALLGCLFVAFFAGIWMGRGARTSSSNTAAQTLAEAQVAADEFQFFAETSPGDTAASSGETAVPSEPPEPVEDTPSSTSSSSSSPSPPEVMKRRVARPRPSTPGPSSQPALAGEEAVIQVSAGVDPKGAEEMVARLRKAGYQAFISPTEVDGRRHYRVRVGPFETRQRALQRAQDLEREMGVDTWVPPNGGR